jgi:hypothetical protein
MKPDIRKLINSSRLAGAAPATPDDLPQVESACQIIAHLCDNRTNENYCVRRSAELKCGMGRYFLNVRPCPGHQRLNSVTANKTWMAGTSPAVTKKSRISQQIKKLDGRNHHSRRVTTPGDSCP